jgi:hypothetical protein
MSDFFKKFFDKLDIIDFIENNLVLEGKPFKYTTNGRAFAKGILRYCAHILPYSKQAKPAVIVKGRQIGLSTASTALMTYLVANEDHKNFLHAFPEIGQARRHSATRLQQLIDDSTTQGTLPKDILNKKGSQSLTQKDFKNANVLFVEGISKDARRIRGMSVDLICYDEFASTTRQAFDNSLQAAANTAFTYINNGATIPHFVFGTPEAENSYFHQLWEKSDKREYHLKCQKCGHHFPIFFDVVSRTEFSTNMLEGTLVKCLDKDGKGCGTANDKMGPAMDQGEWRTPTLKDDVDYVGFYVPQYLNGRITKEMIVDQFRKMPAREFYNEVLGKFYAYEEDALTRQDIIRYTTTKPETSDWDLPSHVLDKQTFMGIDWGARVSGVDDTGSGSYTTVIVLSLMATGHLKLEHASRLSTNDTDEKVAQITSLMKRFNVLKCVVDRGYGQSEFQRLQKLHGSERITMCEWGGHQKRLYNYKQDLNIIYTDKHNSHETFFDEVKQYKFCFPYSLRAEQEIEWLFDHMTNIEVLNVENNGMVKREYHKKSGKETDGLAGLLYAYTAFQFWKTKGFSTLYGNALSTNNRGPSGLQPLIVSKSNRGNNQQQINYSRSDRRRR